MIAVVTGSREWKDRSFIFSKLDEHHYDGNGIEAIVEGGADGADTIAKTWGKMHGVPVLEVEANWDYYERRVAGPLRNGWLIKYGHPDICLAFPLSSSRGTWNMVKQCRDADIETIVYDIPDFVQEVP